MNVSDVQSFDESEENDVDVMMDLENNLTLNLIQKNWMLNYFLYQSKSRMWMIGHYCW